MGSVGFKRMCTLDALALRHLAITARYTVQTSLVLRLSHDSQRITACVRETKCSSKELRLRITRSYSLPTIIPPDPPLVAVTKRHLVGQRPAGED